MTAPAIAMSPAVKERPIVFGSPMVRAILAGTKSMTRRIPTPSNASFGSVSRAFWPHADFARASVDGRGSGSEYLHVPAHEVDCPTCDGMGWHGTSHRLYAAYAPPGTWDPTPSPGYTPPASRLWVRESVRWEGGPRAIYQADDAPCVIDNWPWQRPVLSPIHLPYGASRIRLWVTEVRVERLQAISEADAKAEGIGEPEPAHGASCDPARGREGDWSYRLPYSKLWDSINSVRPGASWEANPWCWVVCFSVGGRR